MQYWTFDFLRETLPHFYPSAQKFWFPLYLPFDHEPGIEAHCHEFVEIALVLHGKARHTRFPPGGKPPEKTILSTGAVFGIPIGEYHEISDTKDNWRLLNILFDPSVFGPDWERLLKMPGLDALLTRRKVLHLSSNCFEDISTAALHLQQELLQRAPQYEMNLKGLLQDLLIRIGRSPIQKENLKTNVYTDKAVQFILGHFAEKITLDEIARHVGLSKMYLGALFRKEIGCSPWDFLHRVRIGKAKFYLQAANNARIGEAAAICGFENNSYFTRVFRKIEGVSPREYLEKIRSPQQDAENTARRPKNGPR